MCIRDRYIIAEKDNTLSCFLGKSEDKCSSTVDKHLTFLIQTWDRGAWTRNSDHPPILLPGCSDSRWRGRMRGPLPALIFCKKDVTWRRSRGRASNYTINNEKNFTRWPKPGTWSSNHIGAVPCRRSPSQNEIFTVILTILIKNNSAKTSTN